MPGGHSLPRLSLTELTTATQCSVVHLQWSSADYKWYSTPPLVSLSVLVNTSTSHRFFATSSIGCQCLRWYSSKLLHRLLTVSKALGLSTSAALPAQSLTILAVLVSARPSVVICSFHEPGSVGGAFSSQLQLSGTHCRFTFARRPSVAVSFEQGSTLIFSGWPFTDFSRDWTESLTFLIGFGDISTVNVKWRKRGNVGIVVAWKFLLLVNLGAKAESGDERKERHCSPDL